MTVDHVLPNINLAALIKENPIIILNNRIYIVESEVSGSGTPAQVHSISTPDKVTDIELLESETLANYEKGYLVTNGESIKSVIQQLAQGENADLEKRVRSAELDLFALKERFPVIEFIYSKVFPYYTNKKDPTVGIIKTQPINRSFLDGLINIFHFRRGTDPYQKLLTQSSLLEQVLAPVEPLFMGNSLTYKLTTKPQKATTQMMVLGDTRYRFEQYGTIKDIEDRFLTLLYERIKKLLADDKSFRDLAQKLKEKTDFTAIVQKNEYMDKKGIGFLINEGKYYVTTHIPEFTLQDAQCNFYAFTSCTVAVRLQLSNDEVADWDMPIVWEPYSHPFLSGFKATRQQICLVSGRGNSWVKENIIKECRIADEGKILVGHQVYIALEKARNTLIGGYFGARIVPYHGGLNINNFKDEHERYLSTPDYWRKRLTNNMRGN